MKKILIVLAAVAATAPLWADTSADVLIWNVDTKTDGASYDGATRKFDTIRFWAVDVNDENITQDLVSQTYTGPSYLLNGDSSGLAGSGNAITAFNYDGTGSTTYDGPFYTNLTGYDTGWNFMAELSLGGEVVDRMLSPLTWTDIQGYVISADIVDAFPTVGAKVYNMASTMVPEPTGGLLMLMGGALLALRRRKTA